MSIRAAFLKFEKEAPTDDSCVFYGQEAIIPMRRRLIV